MQEDERRNPTDPDRETVTVPGAFAGPGACQANMGTGICSRTWRAASLLGLVAAAIGILAASSWLSVPFYPVPLTMQTLAVLLVGGLLGPRLGPVAILGYLALGLAGCPVFHNGLGGLAVMLGPTGGYLLGFVPAAFAMGLGGRRAGLGGSASPGHFARPGFSARGGLSAGSWCSAGHPSLRGVTSARAAGVRQVGLLAGGALVAEAAIYACGVPWLAVTCTGSDLGQALVVGALPYLLGDALKVMVAVGALRLAIAAKPGRGSSQRRPFQRTDLQRRGFR